VLLTPRVRHATVPYPSGLPDIWRISMRGIRARKRPHLSRERGVPEQQSLGERSPCD